MAVRLVLVPLASDTGEGVTAILVKTASVTLMSTSDEVMPFKKACTLVGPFAFPVTVTVPVCKTTVAIDKSADVQLTCVLMSGWLPSE